LEDIIVNTVITKAGRIIDTANLHRECAFAYLAACVFAVFDYVERTTGRCDYDDYSGVVSVQTVQELSRAESTAEHARKIIADAELMHQLHNCPLLVTLAEDHAKQLLATRGPRQQLGFARTLDEAKAIAQTDAEVK
jgi:hypothetical protein